MKANGDAVVLQTRNKVSFDKAILLPLGRGVAVFLFIMCARAHVRLSVRHSMGKVACFRV